MSGVPTPDGVTKMIALLDQLISIDKERLGLQRDLTRLDGIAEDLKAADDRRRKIRRELDEHLRAMDVESPGNWGWSDRIAWLLSELVRQTRAELDRRVPPREPPKTTTPAPEDAGAIADDFDRGLWRPPSD